jgi:hypothetical protein
VIRIQRINPYAVVGAVGLGLTIAVVVSTLLGVPSSSGARAAAYAVAGVGCTVFVAFNQERIQEEIRRFLMERVNSRRARTRLVIDLCREAEDEFRAVTFFPVVGIQDDPKSSPREYLNALETKLEVDHVEVTLVSMSCAEARDYCLERGFNHGSIKALDWVEPRLEGLIRRFPDLLTVITIPGAAITVNLCHNHQTALIYHIDPEGDKGSGIKSNDRDVVEVAKGGVTRYATSMLRSRNRPEPLA